MASETLPAHSRNTNMPPYGKACQALSWEEVGKNFSWYISGKSNVAYEVIDHHAEGWRKSKVALYYTGWGREEKYTFLEMKLLTNRFANVLQGLGVKKGDRVAVFMPRSPELYVAFLGIGKVGGVAEPLFEAFATTGLKDRLEDSGAVAIVTIPALRERIPHKELPSLKYILMVDAEGSLEEREVSYEREMSRASDKFDPVKLEMEDPLILHYTSGSTGKPKGVLHVQRALLGHYQTTRWVLDLREDDIYWCTADPGWVTGTSYGIYGPWANGMACLSRGGRFDVEGWYSTIDKYKVR